MWWWIGAAALLLMSLPCGITLGMKVSKGEERLWSPSILPWAIGFHGALGAGALLMVMVVERTIR